MVQVGLSWDGMCLIQQEAQACSQDSSSGFQDKEHHGTWLRARSAALLPYSSWTGCCTGQSGFTEGEVGSYPLQEELQSYVAQRTHASCVGHCGISAFAARSPSPSHLGSVESHHTDSKLLPEVFLKKMVWLKSLISFTCLEDILSFYFILNIYGVGGIQGMGIERMLDEAKLF